MSSGLEGPERRAPSIDDFLVEPTRDLSAWRWLWSGDQPFPIRSHRGLLGRLVVGFKRLFRPLVRLPQNDLWERQRIFNLILLEHLERLEIARPEHQRRIEYQEALDATGLHEIMRHNDALFARADQKLDRYPRETPELARSHRGAPVAGQKAAPPGPRATR